jgi:hypothetical protein
MKQPDISHSPLPLTAFAIALTTVSALVALLVWGGSYGWHIPLDSFYVLFPLLGLLAFSIMWAQYMVATVQQIARSSTNLQRYYQYTGWLFLGLIILHPSLLIAQRFMDGYGLPPHSYETYVAPSLAWLTLLGSACLFIFLAYSARQYLHKYSWWRYVSILNDVAVLGIFYHSIRLGSQLQIGFFRFVWYFYGISLVIAIAYKYVRKYQASRI